MYMYTAKNIFNLIISCITRKSALLLFIFKTNLHFVHVVLVDIAVLHY